MEAYDFRQDFMAEVRVAAEESGEGLCASFVTVMADYLQEGEALPDFTAAYHEGGQPAYRADGYAYDDVDGTMCLVVADFGGFEPERILNGAAAGTAFARLRLFLEAACSAGLQEELEISSPAADMVEVLHDRRLPVSRYRLMIFTDARLSGRLDVPELGDLGGVPLEGQVWDVERISRIAASQLGHEELEIDFRQYGAPGIPCIRADRNAAHGEYRTYVGVMSGTLLADLYDRHGSRLLEGNVRSFLGSRRKTNREIRRTILSAPDRFLAYNNGIAATARQVSVEEGADGGHVIVAARDFQIINGGQTTASLSSVRRRDRAGLDGILVQVKLTETGDGAAGEADELIRQIAVTANSQSTISPADFFSNHPFHRRMEQISRRLYAPAAPGHQHETRWYYERTRGQYAQEQMAMSRKEQSRFQLMNPRQQKITKPDLAKVWNAWNGLPHYVSLGAQKNFLKYADIIAGEWDREQSMGGTKFNELYFRHSVALLIMFRYLQGMIPRQSWYRQGYRANVVCYTLALLHVLIEAQYPGDELDLGAIWDGQSVPAPVAGALLQTAEAVNARINDPGRGVHNISEWCKREQCWTGMRGLAVPLADDLGTCLTAGHEARLQQRESRKAQRQDNKISAQIELMENYPAPFWAGLRQFAREHELLTPSCEAALKVAAVPGRVPSARQCQSLLELLARARDAGFRS